MVTLRSGKAVPFLGKNVSKRKTTKKTKQAVKQSEKSEGPKLLENPVHLPKETTSKTITQTSLIEADQQFKVHNEKPIGEYVQIESTEQENPVAVPNSDEDKTKGLEPTTSATAIQPLAVSQNPAVVPVENSIDIASKASTSFQAEFAVALNNISGTIDQRVLDESSDDSAETMIDDSFELTDYDFDQLSGSDGPELTEPALRLCLPVEGAMKNDNNERVASRDQNRAENKDEDEIKRKPLADLCSVTNISWFE